MFMRLIDVSRLCYHAHFLQQHHLWPATYAVPAGLWTGGGGGGGKFKKVVLTSYSDYDMRVFVVCRSNAV